MFPLSPSSMVWAALGKPVADRKLERGILAVENAEGVPCACCGYPAPRGVKAASGYTGLFPPTFNDYQWIIPSNFLCEDCGKLLAKPVFQGLQNVIVTPSQIFQFQRNAKAPAGVTTVLDKLEQARMILDPPEPPFAMCFRSMMQSKEAHLIWKSRTSMSRDRFHVLVGDKLLLIDRHELRTLLDVIKGFLARVREVLPESKAGRSPAAIWDVPMSYLDGVFRPYPDLLAEAVRIMRSASTEYVLLLAEATVLRTAFQALIDHELGGAVADDAQEEE